MKGGIANVYMLAFWLTIDDKIILGKLAIFEQYCKKKKKGKSTKCRLTEIYWEQY